jgi:hypothetical protein
MRHPRGYDATSNGAPSDVAGGRSRELPYSTSVRTLVFPLTLKIHTRHPSPHCIDSGLVPRPFFGQVYHLRSQPAFADRDLLLLRGVLARPG